MTDADFTLKISAAKTDEHTPGMKAQAEVRCLVLEVLCQYFDSDAQCLGAAYLSRRTGMHRDFVLAACRSLACDGMAEFHKGLWTEDGEPAGSGYAATRDGWRLFNATPTREPKP